MFEKSVAGAQSRLGGVLARFRSGCPGKPDIEGKEAHMKEFMTRVTADRLSGEDPGAPRALAAAAVAGTLTAVLTYRLLRR
jgi:hypothetical protein